jgi:hypothetical protein
MNGVARSPIASCTCRLGLLAIGVISTAKNQKTFKKGGGTTQQPVEVQED